MSAKPPLTNSNRLYEEIKEALENLGGWGSVEIYVQNGKVTQITRRAIRKVDQDINQIVGETGVLT